METTGSAKTYYIPASFLILQTFFIHFILLSGKEQHLPACSFVYVFQAVPVSWSFLRGLGSFFWLIEIRSFEASRCSGPFVCSILLDIEDSRVVSIVNEERKPRRRVLSF